MTRVGRRADDDEIAERLQDLRTVSVKQRLDAGYAFAKVADPQLAQGSSAMSFMLQQLGVVRMAREAVLDVQQQQQHLQQQQQ